MKQYIILVTLLITATISYAQVGIGTSSPASSSQLDVSSTTKGFLPPRMTTSQRDAISSPETGLQIYNTDNRAIETFTGTTGEWLTIGRGKSGAITNTALGVKALYSNTTSGYYNTAIGNFTLFSNTSGDYNTANGYAALRYNTIGYDNTANGYQSLMINSTGFQNTANGKNSLFYNSSGSDNTANGLNSLFYNSTGNRNSAFGSGALFKNQTGSQNVAVGYNALYNNTGSYNTAVGYSAVENNTSGQYNTAIGLMALRLNTTGSSNIALGDHSLNNNLVGNHNTAVGRNSLYQNRGGYNTAIGYEALYRNNSGTYNTAIGYGADASIASLTNVTALGYNAMVNASNKVKIGNSSVTTIEGQVAFTSVSDKRIKENVQEAVPGLSFISELRPVTYTLNTRKQDEITMQAMPDSIKEKRMLSDEDYLKSSSIVRTGFIAQEVEAAANKVGFDFDGVSAPQNETDLYGIRYAEFVVPIVKAMQEQQEIIEEQQATINDLLKRIEALEE
jgi:hypothetical protein